MKGLMYFTNVINLRYKRVANLTEIPYFYLRFDELIYINCLYANCIIIAV